MKLLYEAAALGLCCFMVYHCGLLPLAQYGVCTMSPTWHPNAPHIPTAFNVFTQMKNYFMLWLCGLVVGTEKHGVWEKQYCVLLDELLGGLLCCAVVWVFLVYAT